MISPTVAGSSPTYDTFEQTQACADNNIVSSKRLRVLESRKKLKGRKQGLNYELEKKRHVSYCGSYCHTCDWFTGRIRRTFETALEMVEEIGFSRFLEGKVDIDNFKRGLKILSNTPIDPGCKAEARDNPNDRCKIRQCCYKKGFDLCCECAQFPCELLKTNPGVIRFHCIENLQEIKEKGIEHWIDKQWKEYKG